MLYISPSHSLIDISWRVQTLKLLLSKFLDPSVAFSLLHPYLPLSCLYTWNLLMLDIFIKWFCPWNDAWFPSHLFRSFIVTTLLIINGGRQVKREPHEIIFCYCNALLYYILQGCQKNIRSLIGLPYENPTSDSWGVASEDVCMKNMTIMTAMLLLLFLLLFYYRDCLNVIFSSHPRPMRRYVSSCRQEWWQMKAEPRLEWEENNNYSRYLKYKDPKCKSGPRPNGPLYEGHKKNVQPFTWAISFSKAIFNFSWQLHVSSE
jgi:hypothetical protein